MTTLRVASYMLPVVPMNSTSSDRRSNLLRGILQARGVRAIRLAVVLLSVSILFASPCPGAESNLLLNGDLSAGSGEMPEHWSPTPLAPPGSFAWLHPPGEPSTLEVYTEKGQFRTYYWTQTVTLAQTGWYHLRTEVKTDNPGVRATLKVEGANAVGGATASNSNWTPLEVYFKAVGSEAVQIGCGVRGISAGRAFFRNLILNGVAGAPPSGTSQIDLTPVADLPRSEIKALLDVELAKPSPTESLLGDVVKLRIFLAVLFVLAAITYLDRRYAPYASSENPPAKFFQDRELRKSASVAALMCLLLLATWLVTRVEYLPGHGVYIVERHAVGGDEPHYLVMINSLLMHHDLQLNTRYDDVERGGLEAGMIARRTQLDRHTIIVNRRTGHRAIDMPWYEAGAEFAPSPDVYEIPAHPAGFPLAMAIAVAPMHPGAREVEPDVGLILMLIAWLVIVATYFVGRQVGMGRGWAMLAAAILFAASPWLAYSRAYFAETTIGLALILGLWALMSDLPIVAAIAAAAGAVMKPPFALVGAGFLVEEVREKRWRDAIKIAVVLGLPALEILAYNFWVHRSAFELSLNWSFQFSQLVNTFLGYREGLLLYAPWTIFGFLACAVSLCSMSNSSRLARTMALPIFLYSIVLSSVGFGAGYCYGPRYWVAFMPWLALGTIEAMRRAGRYQRAVCALLVLFAIGLAIPGALRYPQLFRRPVLDAWQGFY